MVRRLTLLTVAAVLLLPVIANAENVPLRVIESSQALQVVHLPGRYAVTAGWKLFIGARRGRNATVIFDWNTGKVTKVDIPGNSRLLGKVGGNLVFERWKTPSNPYVLQPVVRFWLYNPMTEEFLRTIPLSTDWDTNSPYFGYGKDEALVSKYVGQGEGASCWVFQVNVNTGKIHRFILKRPPTPYGLSIDRSTIFSMTPDEQHFLTLRRELTIIDISTASVVGRFSTDGNPLYGPQFITNNLVYWYGKLRNLSGKLVGTVKLTGVPGKIWYIKFSPDLNHALVVAYTGGVHSTGGTFYVDSSAFRRYVDKLGYLFHPTTGVMTSSEVNFRQYPNLKAKVIGTLNTGEKLIVLDRSGAKHKIEGYDSYWYKVKTAGGTVGWMYGAFIDLR